jgi:tetratricopeptide (TPR) repeat protein
LQLQAVILQKQGDLKEAMARIKQSERICRLLEKQDQLADLLGFQALIQQQRQDWNSACLLLKEEELIWRRLYNRDKLAVSLGSQGNVLRECGRLDEALAKYTEAESILGNENVQLRISVLFNKGSLLYVMRRVQESLPLLEEAHCLAVMQGDDAISKQIQGIYFKAILAEQANVALNSPRPTRESTISELRASAATALKRGLWEAAETYLENLLQQGEPVETVAPDLINVLLNAHEMPTPATVTRIETLLQKLEQAGHANLAAPLRQQLQAKLPRKKKGWKFW